MEETVNNNDFAVTTHDGTRISIVTPFYNEGPGVDAYFREISKVMAQAPELDFEVICVDDGSSDDTLPRLLQQVAEDARVQVIELSRNFGKEAAMTAGIQHAGGDAVIPIDADLQDPPELIPQMIEQWRAGAEVVLARRIDRSTDSWLKRVTAGLFYRIHNRLSEIRIPQNVGDYRLLDRQVVEALNQLPEQQRFMKGLFAWVGFRTATVDYVREARSEGTSKFSGWSLWNFALEGITSFSTLPLKFWSYVGLIGAATAFFYALFIVSRVIIFGVDVPGYASLLVAILFIGSVQLISIGMLGEYIGRIYMETKRRPTYLVRKHHGQQP